MGQTAQCSTDVHSLLAKKKKKDFGVSCPLRVFNKLKILTLKGYSDSTVSITKTTI